MELLGPCCGSRWVGGREGVMGSVGEAGSLVLPVLGALGLFKGG